uniref:Uncharacterized protein n=1 Tax=Ditylenchus dipsaci TaxID=166011 RepID=A0A915CW93_9BILA
MTTLESDRVLINHGQIANEEPLFGIEQEYLLLDRDGYPSDGQRMDSGSSRSLLLWCWGGSNLWKETCGNSLSCLSYAGIEIAGTNAESGSGQWEISSGDLPRIDIVIRCGCLATYCPERGAVRCSRHFRSQAAVTSGGGEVERSWCHTNFSSAQMRADGGLAVIEAAIQKMSIHHKTSQALRCSWGVDNVKRLSGHDGDFIH